MNKRNSKKPLAIALALLCSPFLHSTSIAAEGIESDGTVYFDNEGWTGSWNYICLDGNCMSGTLENNRWQRQFANLAPGSTHTIQLKVQDNALGQYISKPIQATVTSSSTNATPSPTPAQTTPPPPPVAGATPTPTTTPIATPNSTPDPNLPSSNSTDFVLEDQGNGVAKYAFIHQDDWPTEGTFYSCQNDEADCYPATLINGRWERDHGPMGAGQTYLAKLKVPGLNASDFPTAEFIWDGSTGSGAVNPPPANNPAPNPGNNSDNNAGNLTCAGFECLEWEYSSHRSSDGMEPHDEGAVGPIARTNGPEYLATPTSGSEPSNYGFAFDIENDTLSWRWGPGITKREGDSGLEMHCSQDNGMPFESVSVTDSTANIPCTGNYIYFFRYLHPHSLNNDPGYAWIYTGGFTTERRVNPNNYASFTDGSANWMRFRHPVSHDGVTAAVLDAQHNNDQLRRLDRYTIWFDDSPGNVQLGVDLSNAGDTLIRNEAMRNAAGGPNGQQFFSVNMNPGFGNAFSYGQVIQFEFTAVAGGTGAQTYNDFSYYTVGHGWGAYGDPRLNSAGKAGTTMIFSDNGTYSHLEYNAVFTQPVTTLNSEQDIDDFLVGHHLFHGIDPKQIRSSEFDVIKIGDRTCGDCHFRDGRGSEVVQTPKGPRLPPPTYGVKLLEVIKGREVGMTWDGSTPTVEEQVRIALVNDHGVDPNDLPTPVLDLITAYTELLTVPNRKPSSYDLPGVTEGDILFNDIGCADCHTPVQITESSEPQWNNLTIRPYTDMKTWDLGQGDFRTAPLWGLGHNIDLLERNNRALLFMHDGSATSVQEAIQQHGGQAAIVRSNYNDLSNSEKQYIINFVRTL